ncbi:hypothetical protein THAOC_11907, partial [Thalassiosira oceanica]
FGFSARTFRPPDAPLALSLVATLRFLALRGRSDDLSALAVARLNTRGVLKLPRLMSVALSHGHGNCSSVGDDLTGHPILPSPSQSSSVQAESCRVSFRRAFGAGVTAFGAATPVPPKTTQQQRNESTKHITLDERSGGDRPPSLVGSIDQGTSSSRFLLVDSDGSLLSTAQVEFRQIFPESSPHRPGGSCVGWHEHDPFDIYDSVAACVARTFEELAGLGLDLTEESGRAGLVKTVGITNQRETTVAWNDRTGRVYHNAIVWDDTRTAPTAEAIIRENSTGASGGGGHRPAQGQNGPADRVVLRRDEGAVAHRQHPRAAGRPDLRRRAPARAVRDGRRLAAVHAHGIPPGGVGGRAGRASRARGRRVQDGGVEREPVADDGPGVAEMGRGDRGVRLPARLHPRHRVPGDGLALRGVVVGSMLGDQQAALFGQSCFNAGEAKCTYGTGLFLLMVTGGVPVPSKNGLLTTVAYQLCDKAGQKLPPVYALEGSVAFSGSTIGWLRDRIELIGSASETEALALSVPCNGNMYLVPAFSGLFCPHWKSSARGCIVGLTATHSKAHIVRAALEASAFQAKEVFDAMIIDSQVNLLENLRVDGGATANKFLLQFQADLLNVPVIRPKYLETTAMGVAYGAGLAVGLWTLSDLKEKWKQDRVFSPTMPEAVRVRNLKGWSKAIKRSLEWTEEDD